MISVYVIYDAYSRSLEHGSNIGFVVVSLLMVFINLIIFDVYERMISHTLAEKKNLIYEQEIEMCNRQAKDREAAYQQTRMLRHDLNDRLIGIGALLESGHSDEAVGEIVEHGDGTIRSSKGPGELHGYGLVSVRKTVGKYNGDLVIRHGGGVFRASAILYPK